MAANVETFVKIASAVGNGSSSTISFTNIPNSYTDLVVRGQTQSSDSSVSLQRVRLNDSSGSDYVLQRMATTGQGNFTGTRALTGNWFVGDVPTSSSNYMSSVELNVFSYADVEFLYPTMTASTGSPVDGERWHFSCGTWTQLTAVNRIDFFLDTGAYTTNSKLTLYGILRA
jgi:hypothetical protein